MKLTTQVGMVVPGACSAVASMVAVLSSNSRGATEVGSNQAGAYTAAQLRSPGSMLILCCLLLGLPALVMWLLSGRSRRALGRFAGSSSVVLPAAAAGSVLKTS